MKKLFVLILAVALLCACGKKEEKTIDKSADAVTQLSQAFEIVGIRGDNLRVVSVRGANEITFDVTFDYTFTVWDETDFVGKAMGAYVAYCEYVYAETQAKGITFYIYGGMTDANGNTTNQKMFTMSMPRAQFMTFNWENLYSLDGTYSQIEKACTELFIAPGVRNAVNFSKVHLTEP